MESKRGDRTEDIRRAALMGVVAGLRSQVPFLMLSRAAGDGTFANESSPPLAWLRKPRVRTALAASAAGEMIADKLPFIPNRTDPGPLFGRLLVGALTGAAIAANTEAPVATAALTGGCGAVVGSFAGRHLRIAAARLLGLPDFAVALVEDGVALKLGARAAQERAPIAHSAVMSQSNLN